MTDGIAIQLEKSALRVANVQANFDAMIVSDTYDTVDDIMAESFDIMDMLCDIGNQMVARRTRDVRN